MMFSNGDLNFTQDSITCRCSLPSSLCSTNIPPPLSFSLMSLSCTWPGSPMFRKCTGYRKCDGQTGHTRSLHTLLFSLNCLLVIGVILGMEFHTVCETNFFFVDNTYRLAILNAHMLRVLAAAGEGGRPDRPGKGGQLREALFLCSFRSVFLCVTFMFSYM